MRFNVQGGRRRPRRRGSRPSGAAKALVIRAPWLRPHLGGAQDAGPALQQRADHAHVAHLCGIDERRARPARVLRGGAAGRGVRRVRWECCCCPSAPPHAAVRPLWAHCFYCYQHHPKINANSAHPLDLVERRAALDQQLRGGGLVVPRGVVHRGQAVLCGRGMGRCHVRPGGCYVPTASDLGRTLGARGASSLDSSQERQASGRMSCSGSAAVVVRAPAVARPPRPLPTHRVLAADISAGVEQGGDHAGVALPGRQAERAHAGLRTTWGSGGVGR